MSPRKHRALGMRRGWLMLGLAVAIIPFGVPKWLNGNVPATDAHADANFATLCRDHGGTPATPSLTGKQPRRCTVRYGGRVYVMDAITPAGFDADAARWERLGCETARRQQRAAGTRRRSRIVYHANTGVCERRL